MTNEPTSTPENQTEFFEEDRTWENAPFQAQIPTTASAPAKSAKTNKLIPILLIGTVVLLLLTVIVKPRRPALAPPPQNPEQLTIAPTAAPAAPENKVQRAIQNLNDEIVNSDPYSAELSFPPISFDLGLKDSR